MSIVTTQVRRSFPLVEYTYLVTGLVNGANTVTLPTPPAVGSFPPAGDWTPLFVYAFPYNIGAVGAVVTVDPTTIVNTAGAVTFTLYAGGATDALIMVA